MNKKVLVLGAGLVAKPLVKYLLNHGFEMTIATRTVSKAQALLEGHANGTAVALDLNDPEGLDDLIRNCDLAISLVPYTFHVQVARRCLAFDKHLVTTSYVSNEMRALSGEAEKKGLLFLNEIGLDPGIDHMSAMRIIDTVKSQGGTVTDFRSYCGGLPAPDANDNPWGYKFSWSPRGVLLAGRNSARYLEDDKVKDIESQDLFLNNWPLPVEGIGKLEAYPNRDSMQYVGLYHLESAKTLFRGTLRYPNWCLMMKALVDLGWVSLDEVPGNATTLGEIFKILLNVGDQDLTPSEIRAKAAERLGIPMTANALERFEWVGLFSDYNIEGAPTILDALGKVLEEKLSFKPGERDMIVLFHEFFATKADGSKQRITSLLADYGVPHGDSAMARTVSLPAAIATRMILEGKIKETGVHIPVSPAIYNPVLNELEKLGIVCKENFEA